MTARRIAYVVGGAFAFAALPGVADANETSREPIVFLAPSPELSVDRDLPAAVRKRYEREQRRLLALAREASTVPATRAAGCVAVEPSEASIGPPVPRIAPRVLGHHVDIVFEFARLPESLACRPWEVTVVVYAGLKASSSFKSQVRRFRVSARRARVAVDLPWFAQPPYSLIVSSSTILGRRGPTVERPLRCPGTGQRVVGCLPGYRPGLHDYPMPKPVLPIRGVTRTKLEASLRYVVAAERKPPLLRAIPVASRCPSLKYCDVTYADRSFPDSAYRVRYRIAGQQASGCWMGIRHAVLGRMPYNDAGAGQLQLTGCTAWLQNG